MSLDERLRALLRPHDAADKRMSARPAFSSTATGSSARWIL
jgi:hypothetical protein